jgi:chromosome segregation protein
MRVAGERVDLTREAGELRERHAQLARRAARLAAEGAEATREARELEAARAARQAAHDRALSELASLDAARRRAVEALAAREADLARAGQRLGEARLALAARRSSLEALRALEQAREGYGGGVRAVFEGRGRLAGVIGTVADLLEVPSGLERAVEAVLGERLQWVVVERFEHARAAVAYLAGREAGSATFLPLEHLQNGGPRGAPPGSPHVDAQPAELEWATRSVSAAQPGLVQYLLGQVAVVDHLDRAEELWRRNGVVATYVTPSGEVLSPTGRLRGGAVDASADPHSLLGRKRQLREMEEEVRRMDAAVESAEAALAELEGGTRATRETLLGLDRSVQSRQADRLTTEKDLEQAARERERVGRHLETLGVEQRQVETEAGDAGATLAALEQRIAAAGEVEARQEGAMALARAAIEAAQDREAQLVAGQTTALVELAQARQRAEALGRELTRLDEMEGDVGERLAQGRQRQDQLAERGRWLTDERERTDVQAREVAVERDRLEAEARAAGDGHEELLAALAEIEGDARGVDGELRRLGDAAHEVELNATEGRVRREELAQEARRAWGVETDGLLAAHDPARDLAGARARLHDLETRLDSMGPVNLVADEEYRELDERLTFLRTQHDDLVASIKDLEKALRGMTRTAQERFQQAFVEVNGHFGRIFERLFEGGRAELRLVEAEEGGDPLDTGVELMAQPRGKRLQSVSLMSGGERALTGLALLFAIFYYRPSPFCVLDEVDAPLDDANIHRFIRVLSELTSQTQFLVITHNRKTMEAADILYGVTMEEPGLSKLVSVNLAAVAAAP